MGFYREGTMYLARSHWEPGRGGRGGSTVQRAQDVDFGLSARMATYPQPQLLGVQCLLHNIDRILSRENMFPTR